MQHSNIPRAQVSNLLKARMSDASEILRCAREAQEMKQHNVSKGHRQRRVRIKANLEQHQALGGNALGLIRMWESTVSAATAKGYVATLLKEHPEVKDREVKDAQDRIRQKASVLATKRAPPLTPPMFKRLIAQAPPKVAHTVMMLLLSASRHMDLLKVARYRAFTKGIIMLQWANWKSDRYGERAFAKFIEVPEKYRHLLQKLEFSTYQQVYRELKKIDKSLSVHSVRRAATFYLAEAGCSMAEIQLLTGHTPTSDPCLAVRRYVDPTPNQPESRKQIRMSRILAQIFGLVRGPSQH